MRPVLERLAHFLADEQGAKTRAVDEDVTLYPVAGLQDERAYLAAFPVALDLFDAALDAARTEPLGEPPQIARIEAGIELIGIGETGKQAARIRCRKGKFAALTHPHREGIVADTACAPLLLQPVPDMMERNVLRQRPIVAEGVDIGVADPRPVTKLDAELERRLGGRHQVAFVDAERPVEEAHVRKRGFSDAHRSDLFGLHKNDAVACRSKQPGQAGSRHPARRAAASDHDPPHLHHSSLATSASGLTHP